MITAVIFALPIFITHIMKKITLLFAFVLGFGLHAQVCTPDPNLTQPGFYPPGGSSTSQPVVMPDGYLTEPYSEVAQFVLPEDTTIDYNGQMVTAQIDSIRILNFENLPPGIAYQCNIPRCVWAGGETGCVLFSGNPTQVGKYEVKVKAIGYATVFGFITVTDSIEFEMEFNIYEGMSVQEHALLAQDARVYYTAAGLQIDLTARHSDKVQIELYNMAGQRLHVYSWDVGAGESSAAIPLHLPRGLYVAKIVFGQQTFTRKVTVQH